MDKHCDSVGTWISILYRFGQCHFVKELDSLNIGSGQYIFLITLLGKDGISQEELSAYSKIDKATTAKAIKKLETEGYIKRIVDVKDKRAYKVYLTEKALGIMPCIQNAIKKWEEDITRDLTDIEKHQVSELLRKMAGNACSCKLKEK